VVLLFALCHIPFLPSDIPLPPSKGEFCLCASKGEFGAALLSFVLFILNSHIVMFGAKIRFPTDSHLRLRQKVVFWGKIKYLCRVLLRFNSNSCNFMGVEGIFAAQIIAITAILLSGIFIASVRGLFPL
jgi:hypothetical protein